MISLDELIRASATQGSRIIITHVVGLTGVVFQAAWQRPFPHRYRVEVRPDPVEALIAVLTPEPKAAGKKPIPAADPEVDDLLG